MDKPLISVIVLTYKKFQFFRECIDSVLNQTYPKIELIISDDASDNIDLDYISEYIKNNKKENVLSYKIIHHENNIGTVKNYNDAIKVSKGEYIIGLAADDCFYDNNTIDNIVNNFLEKNALIVTAYREVYNETLAKFIRKLPNKKEVKSLKDNEKLYKVLCKGNFISGACTYYSKKFFNKYELFDEEYKLLEDYPKYLYVVRNKCKIEFLDKPTIKYRLGGISTQNNINPLLKKDFQTAIIKEILPYKNHTGLFINRLKTFEYNRMIKKDETFKLIIKFPDIVLYKIIFKIKNKIF